MEVRVSDCIQLALRAAGSARATTRDRINHPPAPGTDRPRATGRNSEWQMKAYLAVSRAHRDSYTGHDFYLLAVVGPPVGFALNQTQGAVLAWSHALSGIGDCLAGFCRFDGGRRQLQSVLETRSSKRSLLLAVEDGHHPEIGQTARRHARSSGRRLNCPESMLAGLPCVAGPGTTDRGVILRESACSRDG